VAVHPDDERYQSLMREKRHAILPLVGRRIPIVADTYCDPEKGTGAVKITPAHDFNDFEVARRHKLPMISIFDAEARLNDQVPERLRGLEREEGRKCVLAELDALGLVAKVEDNPMTLPFGDRSGVVIEPRLTDQWYVDAKTLAAPAIKAVEDGRIRFVPKHWENTYFEWMRNIQPWCISRQIWWGHQIPAWYGPDGHVFVEMTDEDAAAAAAKHYGRKVALTRDSDVLDTWFSSALWPFSTLGWPEETAVVKRHYPTDVLVTGFDIIFFWVARMVMMGMHFMGEVPFRTVYVHALVRDEKGQKMSKSKGNVLDPLDLIDKYGADALRFTLTALAAQGRDIKLSAGRIEGYRNFVTKIWNATRYAEMNGCKPVAAFDPATCTLAVDRWIVGELAEAGAGVIRAIEDYRFNDAAQALYQFAWHSFCDWYIEFTKPVLTGSDEAAKAEVRATTAWVLERLVQLLHPFMPFVTEELWHALLPEGEKRPGLLMLEHWPDLSHIRRDSDAIAEMHWIIRLISEVRAIRAEMNVPPGAKLALYHRDATAEARTRLTRNRELIERIGRLGSVSDMGAALPKGAAQFVVDGVSFALPLGEVIDLRKERERLAGGIKTADQEIARIDGKLGNASFVSRAPTEVVEEQRERRAEYAESRAKLSAALERLGAG